ncbi:MAG: hypothetical protein EU552_02625 [Promethearchaeota archaeon]|nr:MAG: hypothetical protein EU552_02625 [Candidatus Lokiarchaeota archaeon]
MSKKEDYPKEIITYERVSYESEEKIKVITVVKNEYEEKAVLAAISFMNAFNKSDPHECDKYVHYPHIAILVNGNIISTEKPPFLSKKYFEAMSKISEWHHTCWDTRHVLHSGKNKIHLELQFTRYKYDGTKIASSHAIWIITNQNGYWGVVMRSVYV